MCVSCRGKAIVHQRGEGEGIWFDGGLLTVKASAEDTAGAYAVFEYLAPAGKASPLHHHPDADETFYLLEGAMLVHVDGVEHEASEGATITFLRGVPHAYAITSEQARILMVLTPGAGLNFFREAGEPAASVTLPPPRERNLEQFQAAAAGNGVVLLGPPPFDLAALAAH